jgi:hypothetical protein
MITNVVDSATLVSSHDPTKPVAIPGPIDISLIKRSSSEKHAVPRHPIHPYQTGVKRIRILDTFQFSTYK